MAYSPRKFFDLHSTNKSQLAKLHAYGLRLIPRATKTSRAAVMPSNALGNPAYTVICNDYINHSLRSLCRCPRIVQVYTHCQAPSSSKASNDYGGVGSTALKYKPWLLLTCHEFPPPVSLNTTLSNCESFNPSICTLAGPLKRTRSNTRP